MVQCKSTTPWTKPEDLDIDDEKLRDKLGGIHEGGFYAALLDASVHFLPDDIEEATLDALMTKAGGEVVEIPGR
jgi:hypothetical protein